MSKKNENINEEVKNAEETAEDIKDTETKEDETILNYGIACYKKRCKVLLQEKK